MSKGSSEEFKQVATLVDLLRFRATHQSESTAYDFYADGEVPTASLTYGELDQTARAVATLLQSLGCFGKPVLLLYPPGLDYIAAFLGCALAGAIAVPAYPPRPNRSLERLQVMIQDAGAAVALTHSDVLGGLERRFAEYPFLKKLHWLATDIVETALSAAWTPPAIEADSLALLQYTSGSTGQPKGVMVSHGNLLHNSARICHFFGHSEASRGVSWLPPYHDMGLVGGIIQPLYVGVPTALMPPVAFLQKPLRWLRMISQYGATSSGGPNFAYDLCVQKTTPEQRAQLDLSHWQVAFSGAEPVRPETLQRFADTFASVGFRSEAFYPCYGMAETTLMVTGGEVEAVPRVDHLNEHALRNHQVVAEAEADGQAVVSCGRSSSDQGLLIVDPNTGIPCSDEEVGEIWVGTSGSLAKGYWRQPDQTHETFQAQTAAGQGPFLRTGDLGFLREGELFVTGRRKELIIIRGRNYYPKDIETTVEMAHEALRPGAGAAFAVTVEGQERLVVVQEVKRTYLRNLDGDAIIDQVRRAIAEQHDLQLYALQLIKTGSIPKTSSGKIQRLQCRSGYLDHQLASVHDWQLQTVAADVEEPWLSSNGVATVAKPHTKSVAAAQVTSAMTQVRTPDEIQQLLKTWLAQELNVSVTEIDVTRPFAEYGLDSVTAAELTDALQTAVDQPLSATLAYEYPTIEAVANFLGAEFAQPASQREAAPAEETDEDDLAALMNELEDLSEADLEKLLEQQGR